MPPSEYVTISHSENTHPPNTISAAAAKVSPREKISAMILLRSRNPVAWQETMEQHATRLPRDRRYYTAAEFNETFGPSPADVKAVRSFLRGSGLQVVEENLDCLCLCVQGTTAAFGKAFQVTFQMWQPEGGSVYRSYAGPLRVPKELGGVIDAVLGLDNRQVSQHHLSGGLVKIGKNHAEARRVAGIYKFPGGAKPAGCIAIIELAGGFAPSTVRRYFRKHKQAAPKIVVVEVDGQKNNPAPAKEIDQYWEALEKGQPVNPSQDLTWTIETSLDVELAGSFATVEKVLVYMTQGTMHGKLQAFMCALSDKRAPSVISCSGSVPTTR